MTQLRTKESRREAGQRGREVRDVIGRFFPVAKRTGRRGGRRFPDELGIIIALLVLVGFVGVLRPAFLRPQTLLNLTASATFIGVLAIGCVFLLVMREIDLSFPWMFNFSAVITALAMVNGVEPFIAAAAGIAFGTLLGLVNGVLAVVLRLPVLIITLGTFSMYRGLSLVVNDSRAVVPPRELRETGFFRMIQADLPFGIRPVMVVLVVLVIVFHIVLNKTRFGYRVFAIGSNPEAARLAGIPIARTKIQVTALMGALAGLGGALFVGFRGAVDPGTGSEYLLPVIAAVIIGGTPLAGGAGTIIGALVGVLIIAVISTGVVFLGIDAVWSTFVTGLVIVVAVGVDQLVRHRRRVRADRLVDAI